MDKEKPCITGRLGELAAADYLCVNGFKITCTNYHTRYGEIDIIAENCDYIIFAEVKTRRQGSMLLPREAVDSIKQKKLIMSAQMYLSQNDIGRLQPRFDVIEVYVTNEKNPSVKTINWIENAFMS